MHIFLWLIFLSAPEPTIALVDGKVEVSGLPAATLARLKAADLTAKQWPDVFRLVVAGGKPEEEIARLPMAGTYTLSGNGIRFSPQFPLLPGREYRAIIRPDYDPSRSAKGKPITLTLSVPKPVPGPRVSVAAVYPSGNRLPENTLRFYIQFSAPVARGDVYRHLKLVREDGVEVTSPFLELEEELWSADGTRLTVLFHPGRVKRELVPREQEGPILEAGRGYTLAISERWEDTEGRPILAGYRKQFTAGPADEAAVDPAEWAVTPPRAGSTDPLLVRLPKPLDHALLGRLVWVVDAAGTKVPGTLTVGGGERVLTVAPDAAWKAGEYRLAIDKRLEDACGNRVGEPFEVDVFKPVTGQIEKQVHERAFRVR
jgi:hypothetical protein